MLFISLDQVKQLENPPSGCFFDRVDSIDFHKIL